MVSGVPAVFDGRPACDHRSSEVAPAGQERRADDPAVGIDVPLAAAEWLAGDHTRESAQSPREAGLFRSGASMPYLVFSGILGWTAEIGAVLNRKVTPMPQFSVARKAGIAPFVVVDDENQVVPDADAF